jgi:hypothetical protein
MNPSSDKQVKELITNMGFNLSSVKGINGKFYTTDRYRDLMLVVDELLAN